MAFNWTIFHETPNLIVRRAKVLDIQNVLVETCTVRKRIACEVIYAELEEMTWYDSLSKPRLYAIKRFLWNE